MKLIKLDNETSVNLEYVQAVSISGQHVLVQMATGEIHAVLPGYNESTYKLKSRIESELAAHQR